LDETIQIYITPEALFLYYYNNAVDVLCNGSVFDVVVVVCILHGFRALTHRSF